MDANVTHYLNVDLEISSMSNLQPLVTALEGEVFVLFVGRVNRTYRIVLEIAGLTRTADATILAFCALIRSLPRAKRKLWTTAKRRNFSVGVQAAMMPSAFDVALSADTVKSVSRLNARIVFTVYPPRPIP